MSYSQMNIIRHIKSINITSPWLEFYLFLKGSYYVHTCTLLLLGCVLYICCGVKAYK